MVAMLTVGMVWGMVGGENETDNTLDVVVDVPMRSLWNSRLRDAAHLSLESIDEPTPAPVQAQGHTPTVTTEGTTPQLGVMDSRTTDEEATPRGLDGMVDASLTISELICAYPWPQGCDYWIAVASCESGLGTDPNAYSDWTYYVGLFQIWIAHGYGREWLKDDANNVLAAWELSHGGTYTGAWPYCQWQ